ncbi:hypothetical protein JOD64_000313 [Micromonospora luteifusca]|uniref:Uncharacterized protein n=1 Tax=Micromonospora luteifusca TaxID=709860 RepID=A0ABS2LLN8_9ACTN|nr:hypothetical protein [Micromonospora luteifusca]
MAAVTLGTDAGDLGPVWVSGLLVTVALFIALPLRRFIAPRAGQAIR